MADFCITAVRYNQARTHIDYVQVREELASSVGPVRTVDRAFIAALIRLNKASFQTRFVQSDGKLYFGAHVHVVDDDYLSTDRNSTKKDNLGNLPEF